MTKPQFKRILVAVKPHGRDVSLVVDRAGVLAQTFGAEVALMSCVYDALVALGLTFNYAEAESARNSLIARERDRLEQLAKPLRDAGAQVSTRVLWHVPVHAGVLDEVRRWHPDLLVVGAHEPRPVPHTVLLDTDWQLIRLCPCPLLLVKEPEFDNYATVLAALDPLHSHGEPDGLDRILLDAASALSRAFAAELVAVHAFPDPADFALARSIEVQPGVWYGVENIESVHRQAVTELVSFYGITPDRIELLPGPATDVIMDVVAKRNATLLVVGAFRRGRLRQATLGSTAEWVAAGAECDVLLIKPP